LSVVISNRLSFSQHVQNVVVSCAQTVHALRTLRNHGVMNTTLQIVSSWLLLPSLFTLPVLGMAFARQPTEIVLRQSSCSIDQLSVRELIDDADDSLLSQLMNNENHVLHQLLPARRQCDYDLRPRNHDLLLTQKPNSTVESDSIIRMLFRDSY